MQVILRISAKRTKSEAKLQTGFCKCVEMSEIVLLFDQVPG